MAIKITTNYDIKDVLKEIGVDYSDFISYINNKPKSEVINSKNQNTVVFVIDMFIKDIYQNESLQLKSRNTIKYYMSFLNRFKKYVEKNYKKLLFIDLNEIIFHNFIENINVMNNIKLTHGTINTYISIISKLCSFALDNGYIEKSINYRFTKIPYTTLPRYFSDDQIRKIFEETSKHKKAVLWNTVFITLLGTGLRIKELVELRIKDFDIENRLIYTLGKGRKERFVPIYPTVNEAVVKYLKFTGVSNLKLAPDAYIFSNEFGYFREKPISDRCVQDNFHKIALKINLDSRLSLHSFRHTFAVNCLKADMQQVYLSQILGHSSPTSTAVYTRLLPQDLQQLIDEKYPFPLEKLLKQFLE